MSDNRKIAGRCATIRNGEAILRLFRNNDGTVNVRFATVPQLQSRQLYLFPHGVRMMVDGNTGFEDLPKIDTTEHTFQGEWTSCDSDALRKISVALAEAEQRKRKVPHSLKAEGK